MDQQDVQGAFKSARISRRKLGLLTLGAVATIAGIGLKGSNRTTIDLALRLPSVGSNADGHIGGCACPLCTGRRQADTQLV
jgi:hypothetical protein